MTKELPFLKVFFFLSCQQVKKGSKFILDVLDRFLIGSVFFVFKINVKRNDMTSKDSYNKVGWNEAVNEMKKFEMRACKFAKGVPI